MPSVLWLCWLGGRKDTRPVKNEWLAAGVVICLERGADLHMAQLMPLPLTDSCFSKIQIEIQSENFFFKSVNIWQSYKQERDCLVHFLCLSEVYWTGTQSAGDNHVRSWLVCSVECCLKQLSAVADLPARLHRAVTGACRSRVINCSGRAK